MSSLENTRLYDSAVIFDNFDYQLMELCDEWEILPDLLLSAALNYLILEESYEIHEFFHAEFGDSAIPSEVEDWMISVEDDYNELLSPFLKVLDSSGYGGREGYWIDAMFTQSRRTVTCTLMRHDYQERSL